VSKYSPRLPAAIPDSSPRDLGLYSVCLTSSRLRPVRAPSALWRTLTLTKKLSVTRCPPIACKAPSNCPLFEVSLAPVDSKEPLDRELPGWWGKIPSTGDFVGRRLPQSFTGPWDRWLSRELQVLKDGDANWQERYANAPIWWFILGPKVVDEHAWIGIITPSTDRVGRLFPLTIAQRLSLAANSDTLNSSDSDSITALHRSLELIGLKALEEALSTEELEATMLGLSSTGPLLRPASPPESSCHWQSQFSTFTTPRLLLSSAELWPQIDRSRGN
jgi:type VI secretion system ImpM family protein